MALEVDSAESASTMQSPGSRLISQLPRPKSFSNKIDNVPQRSTRHTLNDSELCDEDDGFNFMPAKFVSRRTTTETYQKQPELSTSEVLQQQAVVHDQGRDSYEGESLVVSPMPRRPIITQNMQISNDVSQTNEGSPRLHAPAVSEGLIEHAAAKGSDDGAQCSSDIPQANVEVTDSAQDQNDADNSFAGTTELDSPQPSTRVRFKSLSSPQAAANARNPGRALSSPASQANGSPKGQRQVRISSSSVLRPQNQGSRVSKQPVQRTGNKVQQDKHHAQSSSPSSEDIILLLVRRRRQESAIRVRLEHAYHQALAENEQLQASNKTIQDELEQTRQKWHSSIRHDHQQNSAIERYTEKYRNLKNWAHGIAEQYAQLRETSIKFSHELEDVKADASRAHEEKAELQRSCQVTVDKIAAMKDSISHIKGDIAMMHTDQAQVARAQAEKDQEIQRSKQNAISLARLEESQHLFEQSLLKKHNELTAHLTSLSRMAKGWDNTAFAKVVAPLISALQDIKVVGQENLRSINSSQALQTTLTTYNDGIRALQDSMQHARTGQLADHQEYMSAIKASIDELRPRLESIQALEKDNASLAEIVKSQDELLKVNLRDKNAQNLFTMGLLEAHKQSTAHEAPERVIGEHAVAEHWRHMYNNELEKLDAKTKAVAHLRIEVIAAGEKLSNKEYELQNLQAAIGHVQNDRNTAKEALAALREQLGIKDREVQEMQQELDEKRAAVDGLEAQLLQANQKRPEVEHHSTQLESQIQEHSRTIDRLQSDTRRLQEENASLQHFELEAALLQAKLDEFEALRNMMNVIEAEDDHTTLQLLQRRLQRMPNLIRDCENAQLDLQNKDTELSKLRQLPAELKATKETLATETTKYDHLWNQHQELQQKAQKVQKLEEDLVICQENAETLQAQLDSASEELKSAKVDQSKLQDLEYQLRNSEAYNKQLKTDLSNKFQELESAKKAKEEQQKEIKELGGRAAKYDELCKTMEALKDESQQKSAELEDMHVKLNALQIDSARFNPLREQFSEEEIRQFDEPIVLSQMQAALRQTQSQGLTQTQDNRVVQDSQGQSYEAADSADVNDGTIRLFSDFIDMRAIEEPGFINSSPPHSTQHAHPVSPMKTRAGSQIIHATPIAEDDSRVTTHVRASPAPNSAMKRLQVTETLENPAKRLRATPLTGNPNAKSLNAGPRTSPSKTARFDETTTVIPDSQARASPAAAASVLTPGQRKKTNSGSKASSRDRRFANAFAS